MQREAEGDGIKVLPGAVELIALLAEAGVPAVIVSGSSRAEIESLLPRLDPGQSLLFHLGAEDYERGKPAPDGYLKATKRLGVEPSRCLVLEDSEAGIESARRAGIRVWATRAANAPEGTHGHQRQGSAERIVDGIAGWTLESLRRDWVHYAAQSSKEES